MQTIPLSLNLGAGFTGVAIGYRVLNMDRSLYSSWAALTESSTIPGAFFASGGVDCPDEGAYLIVGTALVDMWELTVEPTNVGPQGLRGVQGPAGNVGAQGSQGSAGPQGSGGPAGNQGPQGPQGVQGAAGGTGWAGAQGPAGATGAQGPQGVRGYQGASG